MRQQDQERERVRKEIEDRLNEGRNKFQEAVDLWKEVTADYDYLDEWLAMKEQIQMDLFKNMDFKLNHYEYSDKYYDRCGGSGGSTTNFITWLTFGELKLKFQEALKTNPNLCFHNFFGSLTDCGIVVESDDATGDILDSHHNVSERTFLDPIEEHELFKKRKELQDQKNLEAKMKYDADVRKQKEAEFERLRKELGK